MPLILAEDLDLGTKTLLAIALVFLLFLAVAILSSVSRWTKYRYRVGEEIKAKKNRETPDPWAESAKRLRVEDREE